MILTKETKQKEKRCLFRLLYTLLLEYLILFFSNFILSCCRQSEIHLNFQFLLPYFAPLHRNSLKYVLHEAKHEITFSPFARVQTSVGTPPTLTSRGQHCETPLSTSLVPFNELF